MENYFNCLPKELVYTIVNYISTKNDLDNFINSNEVLIDLFNRNDVWKELYYQNYDNEFIDSDIDSWKMYYMKRYSVLKIYLAKEDKIITDEFFIGERYLRSTFYNYEMSSLFIDSKNNLYRGYDPLYYICKINHQIVKATGSRIIYLLTKMGNIFNITKRSLNKLNYKDIIDISSYKKLFGCISKNQLYISGTSFNYRYKFDITPDNIPDKLLNIDFKQICCSRSHVTILTENNDIFVLCNNTNIKKITCSFNVKKIIADFNIIFILSYTSKTYEIWISHEHYVDYSLPLEMIESNLSNIEDILYTSYFDDSSIVYITKDNKIMWRYTDFTINASKENLINITEKLPFEIDENIIKIVADEDKISFIRLE